MGCNSALYAANTTSQTVNTNGVISFGNIVRRFGCKLGMSGGNVIISGSGYYDIDANFTVEAGTAGVLTIALYKDGVAIPGANASITAVADSVYNITIPVIVRQTCDCESTITAELVANTGTFGNAAIAVEKV